MELLSVFVSHIGPLACLLVAAFIQSDPGFGLVIVAAPLLMFFYPAKLVVLMVLLLALAGNFLQILLVRRDADFKTVLWILAGAVAGDPLGWLVYDSLNSDELKVLISIALLVILLGMRFFKVKLSICPRNSVICGLISGFLVMTTGMGGPPLLIYFAFATYTPVQMRATLVSYFLLLNIASLGMFMALGTPLAEPACEAAWLLPALFLGIALGNNLIKYIPAKTFHLIVVFMLIGICVFSIVSYLLKV